jgi:hypothetical protein
LKEKEMRKYGEYRTSRLVLEAWERLERVEVGVGEDSGEPSTVEEPTRDVINLVEEKDTVKPTSVDFPKNADESQELQAQVESEVDPAPSDYGLYK